MFVTHRLFGLAAIVASATLIAGAGVFPAGAQPTHNAARAVAVTATSGSGQCQGGGAVSFSAELRADRYLLTASASNLPVDGRWRGSFIEQSRANGASIERDFAVRAVDGAWEVTRFVPAFEIPIFGFGSVSPRPTDARRFRLCGFTLKPAQPFAGATYCHKSYELTLLAVRRADGQLVVRYLASDTKPGSRWSVTVAASERGSGSAAGTTAVAGRRGGFQGKVTFEGQTNPRLRLTVVSDAGQRCSLRIRRTVNPSTAMEQLDGHLSPTATARALHELMAARLSHLSQP